MDAEGDCCSPSLEGSSWRMRRRPRLEEPVGLSRDAIGASVERASLLSIVRIVVESRASAWSLEDNRFFLELEVPAFRMRSERVWRESLDWLSFFMVGFTLAIGVQEWKRGFVLEQ